MKLREKGLLVNITISQWSARKYDKKVTQAIEDAHNATNAGNFNKLLLDANSGLNKITNLSNQIRIFLHEMTLPWADNGDRLLPSENYLDFQKKYTELENQFYDEVNKFLAKYPDLKLQARLRLNGMYSETDYPSVDKLRNQFKIKRQWMLLPDDVKDIRIDLQEEEVDSLRQQIEQTITDRFKAGTHELAGRMKDVLSKMYTKLADADAIFRDTLVTNIQDLTALLPKLNITNDPKLADAIHDMQQLSNVDPEAIRSNTLIRNRKAEEAKALMNKIENMF